MTSSLRNSLHRRNHKERSQLAHRARLGLLEKHKDYVLRARDYHTKQDRLARLRQKAATRNKDEFYFSMVKQRTKGGVHIQSRTNVALPTDMVKVLKSQDENYVRTMRASGQKKIDNIKRQLTEMTDLVQDDHIEHLDQDELETLQRAKVFQRSKTSHRKRKHILFAETPSDIAQLSDKKKAKQSPLSPSTPIPSDDLGWKSTEPKKKSKRIQSEPEVSHDSESDETDGAPLQKRKRLLKELSARLDRDRKLRYAEREFEMQRLMMGKGARTKIQGVEDAELEKEEDEDEIDARKGKRRSKADVVDEASYKPRVYKWRLERKR